MRFGVLAQDVERPFPSLVSQQGGEFKQVDIVGLTGVLTAMVKRQSQQLEAAHVMAEAGGQLLRAMTNVQWASASANDGRLRIQE